MKKMFVYGTAVLALSAAPLLAQQTSGAGSGSRQGSGSTTQSGSQSGAGSSGAQSGSGASGASGASGTQSGSRSGASDQGSSTGTGSSRAGASQAAKSNSGADRQFVMEAAVGGLAEVALGQMAGEKAESDQVKQFGQRMVTDHGKANDELKTLAQNKGMTLPANVDAKHKATQDRLSKLSGAAFDRAYMQEMLNDHRKDVNEFRKESQSGKDPDVKAWAAKTLPTLEEHLQMAQSASRGAVGTSGTKSGSEGDRTNGGARGTTGGSAPRSGSGSGSDASGGSTTPRSGGSSSGGSSTGGSSSPSGPSTSSPGGTTGSSSPR
jgi:putative membrane protein